MGPTDRSQTGLGIAARGCVRSGRPSSTNGLTLLYNLATHFTSHRRLRLRFVSPMRMCEWRCRRSCTGWRAAPSRTHP